MIGIAPKFKLENLKISSQINIIAIAVFIGMVFIGGAYYYGSETVANLKKQSSLAREKLAIVNIVQYEFLNARRSEKDFLIRGDVKYLGKHAKNVEIIHQGLADLKTLVQDVSVTDKLNLIDTNFNKYVDQFALVTENVKKRGLTHIDGLEGTLRQSVQNVEKKLKTYNQDDLTVLMLMMRRHEKDFIMRKDPKYIERMKLRLAEFKTALQASFIPYSERDEIIKLMENYHRDFNALAQIELTNQQQISQLSKIFAQSSPLLDDLASQMRDRYKTISENEDRVSTQTFIIVKSIIAIVIILSVTLALWMGKKISRPIERLTAALLQLSENNLTVNIPGGQRGDEIGKMARSVEVLKKNSIEMQRLEEEQKKEQQIQLDRAKNLEMLTSDFEQTVSGLVNGLAAASTELNATAQSMSGIAKETTTQSNVMSSASQSTMENIQTVATASEELSVSIRELSQQVQNTSSASKTAADDAQKASAQINELVTASEKIGDIVGLIQDIAEQTNLLALNATIESARAGEAGKGFAVVANEVKTLASETSKATEQIAGEVQSVQGQIKQAVEAIKNIETKIQDVNVSAGAIAAAIEEQTATTEEINRSTQTSSTNMNDLNVSVSSVNEVAQTTGTAANDVLEASSELGVQTETLKQKVTEFLSKVKSA